MCRPAVVLVNKKKQNMGFFLVAVGVEVTLFWVWCGLLDGYRRIRGVFGNPQYFDGSRFNGNVGTILNLHGFVFEKT
jgi:hypothetical protein